MSKHDGKLEQKSPAKPEISGALDDNDLEKVTGGTETPKGARFRNGANARGYEPPCASRVTGS